jgi:hypothetical protein
VYVCVNKIDEEGSSIELKSIITTGDLDFENATMTSAAVHKKEKRDIGISIFDNHLLAIESGTDGSCEGVSEASLLYQGVRPYLGLGGFAGRLGNSYKMYKEDSEKMKSFEVKASEHAGHAGAKLGNGVVVKTDISADTKIKMSTGLVSESSGDSYGKYRLAHGSPELADLGLVVVVKGESIMEHINSTQDVTLKNGTAAIANVEITMDDQLMCHVKFLHSVTAGSELFMDYGQDFGAMGVGQTLPATQLESAEAKKTREKKEKKEAKASAEAEKKEAKAKEKEKQKSDKKEKEKKGTSNIEEEVTKKGGKGAKSGKNGEGTKGAKETAGTKEPSGSREAKDTKKKGAAKELKAAEAAKNETATTTRGKRKATESDTIEVKAAKKTKKFGHQDMMEAMSAQRSDDDDLDFEGEGDEGDEGDKGEETEDDKVVEEEDKVVEEEEVAEESD